MPRLTNAHKELIDIATNMIRNADTDTTDVLVGDLIKHLPHKDVKEFVELWRPDPDELWEG